MTSAFLKACGNSPEESDLFIISMIMGVKIVTTQTLVHSVGN